MRDFFLRRRAKTDPCRSTGKTVKIPAPPDRPASDLVLVCQAAGDELLDVDNHVMFVQYLSIELWTCGNTTQRFGLPKKHRNAKASVLRFLVFPELPNVKGNWIPRQLWTALGLPKVQG